MGNDNHVHHEPHTHITYNELEIYFKILGHEDADNVYKKSVDSRVKHCKVCDGIFQKYKENELKPIKVPEKKSEEFVFDISKYRKKKSI